MRPLSCFSPVCLLLLVACVGDSPSIPTDSGADAADASSDVQQIDAPTDGGPDAGPSVTGDFESVFLLNDTTTFTDVATDANGDAVMVGMLSGSVQIGSYQYTSVGSRDVLVVRLAANNGIKWAKTFGGTYTEDGNGVALDANGDVYIVGDHNAGGPASQNTPFGAKTLNAPHSGYNSFIAKLDGTNGNPIWVTTFDAASTTSIICSRVVAGASSIIVGCSARGLISYTKTNNVVETRTAGLDDPWVAELDPATGNLSWGVLMTGASQDGLSSLALDAQNRLYVAGAIKSTTLSGDTPSFTLTRKGTNSSATDAYIVRLDPGTPRTVAWQQVYGAASDTTGTSGLALAADGSVYLQGTFGGTRDFGDGKQVTAAGTSDMYLLHLALADGKTLEKTTMGGNNAAIAGHGVAIDDVGQPVIAATYSGSAFTLGGTSMTAATTQNVNAFIAKTTPDLATIQYVKLTAAEQNDAGTGFGVRHYAIGTTQSTGQTTIAGALESTADLGDGQTVTRSAGAYLIRRKR